MCVGVKADDTDRQTGRQTGEDEVKTTTTRQDADTNADNGRTAHKRQPRAHTILKSKHGTEKVVLRTTVPRKTIFWGNPGKLWNASLADA